MTHLHQPLDAGQSVDDRIGVSFDTVDAVRIAIFG
jgi:hypothetical protein